MIAENYRFLTAVQEAKRAIESGDLGTIRLIQIQEEYPFGPGSWRKITREAVAESLSMVESTREYPRLSIRTAHPGICRDCPTRYLWFGRGRRNVVTTRSARGRWALSIIRGALPNRRRGLGSGCLGLWLT
ncbi:MAG: hypothetical protein CM1200mP27_03310 [Chloroflexota bacterium]|nr:MAG: hypothetical protein CM1200mP27_03310 [Chloroflexota bacterium]